MAGRRAVSAVSTLLAGVMLLLAADGGAQTLEVESIPLEPGPFAGSAAFSITLGPDGNIWFTAPDRAAIARLSGERGIDYFSPLAEPTEGIGYGSLITGPDGNLWFLSPPDMAVGRITPAGEVLRPWLRVAPTPAGVFDEPVAMVATRDAVWTRPRQGHVLHRIGRDGSVRAVDVGAERQVTAIAAGPDGELWFAAAGENTVVRLAADGMRAYPVGLRPRINAIAAMGTGPDRNLWFADWLSSRFSRLTPDGALTGFLTPFPSPRPLKVLAGPDGNAWLLGELSSQLIRATPRGEITVFDLPANFARDVAIGTDGRFWITDAEGDHLLRVTVPVPPTPEPRPPTNPPRLYAASQFDDLITPIDLSSLRAGAPFAVAHEAFALSDLQVSVDARYLYAVLGYAVQVIEIATHRVARTIPAPGSRMAIAPDGRLAHLTAPGLGLVEVDLRTWSLRRVLPLGCVVDSAWAPDGRTVYALRLPAECDETAAPVTELVVADVASGGETAALRAPIIGDLAVSPDGRRLYAPADLSEIVPTARGFIAVDLDRLAVEERIRTPGESVRKLLVSSDSRSVYVVTDDVRVHTVDATTYGFVATLPLSRAFLVSDAELHPDGRLLYLLDYAGTALQVDLVARRLTGQVPRLPYEPVALALAIPPPPPTPGPCHADCDGSGSVTVDELILAVRAALDPEALAACPPADGDGDGAVEISDLVAAVNAALFGCAP
ncbi:hypothetical protein KF840_06590 [bacterium]|nr:hypothetical protein [bacterium]